jgi:predicted dehydrogenase
MRNKQVTRRGFLKTAASSLAAPYVITSTALGNGIRPPASDRVTLGFIGVGGRGNALAHSFLRNPEAQCVAVCDCFTSKQESTAKAFDEFYGKRDGKGGYKACAMYGDFRDLLAREDIDGVVIATPDHWHVPLANSAIRAGKDVYVEKPLSTSVSWDKAMRETVQRYGAVFQYGTQQRSDSRFRFACELVRNGYLGALERIEAWCPGMSAPGWYENTSKGGGSTEEISVPDGLDYDMWIGPAPMRPYTKDRCTQWGAYHVYDNALGFIAGWGVHPLDIAQWGNDTERTVPLKYEGTGRIPAEGLFDTISDWDVLCSYGNGVKLRFMNARTAKEVVSYRPYQDHGTTFFGSEGWVSVDRGNPGILASDPELLKVKLKPEEIHLYQSDDHYGNFVNCVKTRRATASPVEVAVQSDIISHLCDICIRTGRNIAWDTEKEDIVGDAAASRMLHRGMRHPWRL